MVAPPEGHVLSLACPALCLAHLPLAFMSHSHSSPVQDIPKKMPKGPKQVRLPRSSQAVTIHPLPGPSVKLGF